MPTGPLPVLYIGTHPSATHTDSSTGEPVVHMEPCRGTAPWTQAAGIPVIHQALQNNEVGLLSFMVEGGTARATPKRAAASGRKSTKKTSTARHRKAG